MRQVKRILKMYGKFLRRYEKVASSKNPLTRTLLCPALSKDWQVATLNTWKEEDRVFALEKVTIARQ